MEVETSSITKIGNELGRRSHPIPIPAPRDGLRRRKRRLAGDVSSLPRRNPVVRVLFGYPDPARTRQMLMDALEANNARFREKWNFDVVTGLPCPLPEGDEKSHRYNWTRVISSNVPHRDTYPICSTPPSPRKFSDRYTSPRSSFGSPRASPTGHNGDGAKLLNFSTSNQRHITGKSFNNPSAGSYF